MSLLCWHKAAAASRVPWWTPNDLDFTSAYQFDPATHAPVPLGTSGFQQGQIFVPGSITGYDSSGNPTSGTPICGAVSAPCNIVPRAMPSGQAPAMINFLSQAYLPGFVPDPQSPNNGGLFRGVFVPFIETCHFNKHQEVVRIDFNVNSKILPLGRRFAAGAVPQHLRFR